MMLKGRIHTCNFGICGCILLQVSEKAMSMCSIFIFDRLHTIK